MTDYSNLRAKAEAATPGPRQLEVHPTSNPLPIGIFSCKTYDIVVLADKIPEHITNWRFIAAANPQTILALLTEREADKARIAELEAQVASISDANHRQAHCINLTAQVFWPDYAATIDALPNGAAHLRHRAERAEADLAEAQEALEAVDCLIRSSDGVAGLHLNGDLAPWAELREGGRFESWLLAFDVAFEKAQESAQ